METSPYNRHPLGPVVVSCVAVALMTLAALFVVNAIEYTHRSIGMSRGALFALLFGSLLGGMVNIPVARVRGRPALGVGVIVAFGVRYRVPVVQRAADTIVAVNLGGAVIPTGLSLFLVVKGGLWGEAALATTVVAGAVFLMARPVPGLGIATPALAPPLLAAAAALVIAPDTAAAVAYVSGSLGTLIGADLLNLGRIGTLGAGVASIGGAGTFDGIVLSGIIAVRLVGLA